MNGDPSAPRAAESAPRGGRTGRRIRSPSRAPGPRPAHAQLRGQAPARSDRAFYLRLAGAIRQNERALDRLKR